MDDPGCMAQVSAEKVNHSNKLDSGKEALEYNCNVNCRLLELAIAS